MKYFKKGDILLSDFDGVFLNSQKRFEEVMRKDQTIEEWIEYLNTIHWKSFLRECDMIPEALETFSELQKLKILRGFITKIHSFDEGMEKALYLRELGFVVPIYYVLPEQTKSKIYIPKKKVILLDDKPENCLEWERDGGRTILHTDNDSPDRPYIKRLSELIQ